jgi:DNA recombination protein RmuC
MTSLLLFIALAFICLGTGLIIGYLYGRNRTALAELAQAQVDASKGAAALDLAERQHAIDALLSPMRRTLEQVQAQLAVSERDRLSTAVSLDEHLAAMRLSADGLRSETSQLVTALRAPQVRGRWGELQLERVVEAAGMVEHIDYVTQPTVVGEDGALRPDLVVRLVGGKNIVVDSKVAFAGYLEAMEARDETVRKARLTAHAKHLRRHIESLGSKQYWNRFSPSPEFVVCFIPADAFLDAALREEPGLLELGFDLNVIIATPSTLVALLRTIGYGWRQQALALNTAEVSELGRELYQRLSSMTGHIDKLGRGLTAAVSAFNSTVGTLDSRVLVSARRLSDLSVVDINTHGALPAPDQILISARSPTGHSQAG